MIDTHAHINTEKFDEDREEVIKRAFDSGLESIIIPAIDPKDFDSLHEIVLNNNNIYCGIGIHPHNVKDVTDADLELVSSFQKKEKVVATGEIGIDYYYDFAPKSKQKEIFDKQLNISLENNNPTIVHNRESDKDLLDIIKINQNGDLTGVLHCFSSDLNTLKKALDLNFLVSFTGNITFKKMDLDDVVSYVPNDRFMIETDSPYMAPVPNRGKRNEPSFVRFVAEKIAEIKKLSFKEVVEMSTNNAKKLFKLPIFLLMFLLPVLAFGQDDEEYYDDDEYYEEEYYDEEYENKYLKNLGVGLIFGSTTAVENRLRLNQDGNEINEELSRNTVLGLGFNASYYIFDFMSVRGSYFYASNPQERDEAILYYENLIAGGGTGWDEVPSDSLPDPTTHQFYELSVMFVANPGQRVEFYGILGWSYITNNFNNNIIQRNGFNFGIGAMINIWESNWGTIAVNGEWYLNYEIGRYEANRFDANNGKEIPENIFNFFSIPRASVNYFFKL